MDINLVDRKLMTWNHSLSRYGGLATKHKSLFNVFVGVYVNLCTVTVIELIVFSNNEVNVQWAIPFNIGTPPNLRGPFIIPLGYKNFRTPLDAIFGSYPMDFLIYSTL